MFLESIHEAVEPLKGYSHLLDITFPAQVTQHIAYWQYFSDPTETGYITSGDIIT
jgi:hypothetical protein